MRVDTPGVSVPVVALYGALNALLNVGLALRVSQIRMRDKVSIGVGGNKSLELAVRVHANNAEFVPLGLVMLLIAELMGGSSLWLHVAGGSLLVGRILHVAGMPFRSPNPARFLGTALTWTMIAATAGWCLYLRG